MIEQFLTNGTTYEIGRGGQGIILANDTYPNVVVKQSSVSGRCGSWNLEFKTLKDINSKFIPSCPEVDIIKVHEFLVQESICYIMMDRIYRPDNALAPAIQTYFGSPDVYLLNKARGLYVGLTQLRQYLSESEIVKMIACLGVVASFVHFGIQYDLTDVEYILGHRFAETTNKIYLLDFDLVHKVDDYTQRSLYNLSWAMNSESYYPKPDTPYYDVFESAYLEQAEALGMLPAAQQVMAMYKE